MYNTYLKHILYQHRDAHLYNTTTSADGVVCKYTGSDELRALSARDVCARACIMYACVCMYIGDSDFNKYDYVLTFPGGGNNIYHLCRSTTRVIYYVITHYSIKCIYIYIQLDYN